MIRQLLVGLARRDRQLPGAGAVLGGERQLGAGQREARLGDLVLVRVGVLADAKRALQRPGGFGRPTLGEQRLSQRRQRVGDPLVVGAQPAGPAVGRLAEIGLGLGVAAERGERLAADLERLGQLRAGRAEGLPVVVDGFVGGNEGGLMIAYRVVDVGDRQQ